MPAGNHGSCIHLPGLDISFEQYNYHDSPQACLIEGIGHYEQLLMIIFLFEMSYQL